MRLLPKILMGAAALALAGAAYAQTRDDSDAPDYATVQQDGAIELRDYPALIVAEVTHEGSRSRASNMGFRRLAAYIFAQERPGADKAQIAMTSPVIQDQMQPIAMTSPVMRDENADGAWRTRFIMPPEYTLDTLPEAADDITLTEMPARRMVAIRFNGDGNATDLRAQEQTLREWMAANDIEAAGGAEFAFYDAPMVAPVYRRNEVMIPVAAD